MRSSVDLSDEHSEHLSKLILILGWVLMATGAAILGFDVLFRCAYGCDVTDVAGVSQGFIIDWPTGERPTWAMVPAYTYSFGFWLLALAAFIFHSRVGRDQARIARYTE